MNTTGSVRLGDFTTDGSVLKLSAFAAALGAIGAGIAWALLRLIAFFTNLSFFGRLSVAAASPTASRLGPWIIVIPALGGLAIGLMARFGSEKIRGHGIPEALEAILIGRSRIEAKVAVLKPLSSAISIGAGGPFGAEGPIIMTGGAVGSLFAQRFRLSAAERKTLLVAGAAGGMAAVFATPVAAVMLAVELLLFEWKPRSLIPAAVASVVAAVARVPLLGSGPMFPVPDHPLLGPSAVGLAALVGLACGFGSAGLTGMVYGCEDAFPHLKLHWMWWPALGGLVVGLGGWLDPRVLGVGYGEIGLLLAGRMALGSLAILLVLKALVWSVSLGSGTSGGVLAPLLMIGGALGAFVGHWFPLGDPGLWAMVGMCAMMGGTMRAPFTAIIFTFELTHAAGVLPLLLVSAIVAEGVTVLLLKRSILTEKVARRGYHLVREYAVDPFDVHRVGEVMLTGVPVVRAETLLRRLAEPSYEHAAWFGEHRALPIVDAEGRPIGMITQSDLLRLAQDRDLDSSLVGSVFEGGTGRPLTIDVEDVLSRAVGAMLSGGVAQLPVVSGGKLVGLVDRRALLAARVQWWEEENLREVGSAAAASA